MAEYLASIFGTEKDKVNCSFFFKMGACTHGDRCSRIHNKPTFSQTMLLQNLYINPQNSAKTADGSHLANVTDEEMQEHYDNFFEDVFVECEDKYGQVEEMNVCDNLGDHLVGNVYVKFKREEDAEKATNDLNNRWFGGRPIYAELTPVTDFREACCRQYETGECTRSGFCNFMHLKPIGRKLRHELYGRSMKGGGVDRSSGGNQVFIILTKILVYLSIGHFFYNESLNSNRIIFVCFKFYISYKSSFTRIQLIYSFIRC